ncbi:MAG: hypothetical protein ACJ8AT_27540 [Hyalangium sp.]|uniref:hypothetical protein n=1 Tax=Hyalangium sp. TaxID=2028555 RepID=UPI003899DBBC
MREYILDTSAIRGMRWEDLAQAAERARITVSPLSVYEILCHIDEPVRGANSTDESFKLRKNHLLRCRLLEIRDDPFLEHAKVVGVDELAHPSRSEDRTLIPKMWPILEKASSAADFMSQTLRDDLNIERELKDVGNRAREVLAEAEKEYESEVESVRRELLSSLSFTEAVKLSGLNFVRYVSDKAKALSKSYQRDGAKVTHEQMVYSTIFYNGYLVARAQRYMHISGRRVAEKGPLKIDPNDMEDNSILLHLDMLTPVTLVTEDTGTLDACDKVLRHLNSASQELEVPVVVAPRVIDVKTFKDELGIVSQEREKDA